jgi:hypothetical protein
VEGKMQNMELLGTSCMSAGNMRKPEGMTIELQLQEETRDAYVDKYDETASK